MLSSDAAVDAVPEPRSLPMTLAAGLGWSSCVAIPQLILRRREESPTVAYARGSERYSVESFRPVTKGDLGLFVEHKRPDEAERVAGARYINADRQHACDAFLEVQDVG